MSAASEFGSVMSLIAESVIAPAKTSDDVITLTPSEISQLDLTSCKLATVGGTHLLNCPNNSDIYKLSADVQRLANAFLQAGAASFFMPLWPVPATVYKMLIKDFYLNLLAGASTKESFSRAVSALQASEKFSHPSYWAGFVLLGWFMVT